MKSYKDLDIYKESFGIAVRVYHLSMKLPHPDRFETGGQIRRSSQTIKDTIVEGYGRRKEGVIGIGRNFSFNIIETINPFHAVIISKKYH